MNESTKVFSYFTLFPLNLAQNFLIIFIFQLKRPFIIFNLSCGERLFIFIFSRQRASSCCFYRCVARLKYELSNITTNYHADLQQILRTLIFKIFNYSRIASSKSHLLLIIILKLITIYMYTTIYFFLQKPLISSADIITKKSKIFNDSQNIIQFHHSEYAITITNRNLKMSLFFFTYNFIFSNKYLIFSAYIFKIRIKLDIKHFPYIKNMALFFEIPF